MANRAWDWPLQAERDLEQAEASRRDDGDEWACFASQQSAEKAVKTLQMKEKESRLINTLEDEVVWGWPRR